MKRKVIKTVICAVMMLALTACGKKDTSELIYLQDFTAGEYVTLGDYKNMELDIAAPAVTDEEVESNIDLYLQYMPVTVPITEDRAAELGDVANIDFVGMMDGVAFDGGSGAGYELVLGSGSFIDGFEDGVVGMEIGETKDLDLTFPDPYTTNPDLSGEPVVFTVTLNSLGVYEPAELNDEFVARLGIEGCSNVDEFKVYIYDSLLNSRTEQYKQNKKNLIVTEMEKICTFEETPEGIVNRMYDTMLEYVSYYAQMYGMEVADYTANVYGGTAEEYEETIRQQAMQMAQRYIMLGAVAEAEGIALSDEEYNEQIAEDAASYNYSVEEYAANIDLDTYKEDLLVEKTLNYLFETVKDIQSEDTEQ